MHATRPYVHVPDDQIEQEAVSTLYVGIYLALQDEPLEFVDRNGKLFFALNEGFGGILAPLQMPSARSLYYLYRLTGTLGTRTSDSGATENTVNLVTAAPYLRFAENVIENQVLGAWEGDVSQRSSDEAWDPAADTRVRIRISFSALEARDPFPVWDDPTVLLADGQNSTLLGTIENWDSSILDADGGCMPALTSYDAGHPFRGASGNSVRIFRYASMHGPGAHEEIIGYPPGTPVIANSDGMAELRSLHPAAMMMVNPSTEWTTPTFVPHQAFTGNSLQIRHMTGGGGACP
jgi:hypothetical protein